MPLMKSGSKKAVGKNIATEMAAGRPKDQSVAIALETQRKAKGKPKRKLVPDYTPAATISGPGNG